MGGYDTNAKVNPPLRSEADLAAIKEGLRDGALDAIASDHAPHSTLEKDLEFEAAAFGLIGLETSLGLSLKLVHEGVLSLSQLIAKMSLNPARILGLPGGIPGRGRPRGPDPHRPQPGVDRGRGEVRLQIPQLSLPRLDPQGPGGDDAGGRKDSEQ